MTNISLSEDDKKIFIKAMEQYFTKEESSITCNSCNGFIVFKKLNEAIVHSCKCGKFNGSLRK
jgi:hypothetical protein